MLLLIFFFNDTATTEIYTLSLHDALPISFLREPQDYALVGSDLAERLLEQNVVYVEATLSVGVMLLRKQQAEANFAALLHSTEPFRSEEHTSELQSRLHLVCRLLLEKKQT